MVEHFKQHSEVCVDQHIINILDFKTDDNGDSL